MWVTETHKIPFIVKFKKNYHVLRILENVIFGHTELTICTDPVGHIIFHEYQNTKERNWAGIKW
jgi:hypothetical protein